MQNLKKYIPAKILVVQGKLVDLPQPTTETSFRNFTYTAIVCNDPQISSFETNLSSEYMNYRTHLHSCTYPKTNN